MCVAVDVIVRQKSSMSLKLPACSLLAAAAFASAMQLSRERCFYRRRWRAGTRRTAGLLERGGQAPPTSESGGPVNARSRGGDDDDLGGDEATTAVGRQTRSPAAVAEADAAPRLNAWLHVPRRRKRARINEQRRTEAELDAGEDDTYWLSTAYHQYVGWEAQYTAVSWAQRHLPTRWLRIV